MTEPTKLEQEYDDNIASPWGWDGYTAGDVLAFAAQFREEPDGRYATFRAYAERYAGESGFAGEKGGWLRMAAAADECIASLLAERDALAGAGKREAFQMELEHRSLRAEIERLRNASALLSSSPHPLRRDPERTDG